MINFSPDWEVWIIQSVAVLGLLAYFICNDDLSKNRNLFRAVCIAIIFVSLVSALYLGGIGHTLNLGSFLGKLLAHIIACSLPVLSVSAILKLRECLHLSRSTTIALSLFMALISTSQMIIIGIVLACIFTNDCL